MGFGSCSGIPGVSLICHFYPGPGQSRRHHGDLQRGCMACLLRQLPYEKAGNQLVQVWEKEQARGNQMKPG